MQEVMKEASGVGQIVKLDRRSVVGVAGSEAHAFLQNLLTCDLETIDRDGAGYGALLTPQGKILFDFLVFTAADPSDGYLLDVDASVSADLAKRLTFYKLRADVTVTSLDADVMVFATWDAGWPANLPGIAHADPRLPDFADRVLAPALAVEEAASAHGFTWVDVAAYDARRVAFGLPEAPADFAFADAFPHDADMDDLNGVAFDKGCFVGQEVVSRMEHRGTARRRIIKVTGDAALPASGTDIVAGGKPAGTLGTTDGAHGLALVRLDRIAAARSSNANISADGVGLSAELPDWATFSWPERASEAKSD